MKSLLVPYATFVFGVVPATYLVFWAGLFLLMTPFMLVELPPPLTFATIGKVVAFMSAGAGGVVGYGALIYTARGIVTRRVVAALLVGIAANGFGICLLLDFNPRAPLREWGVWYFYVAPIIVAIWHIGAYCLRGERAGA